MGTLALSVSGSVVKWQAKRGTCPNGQVEIVEFIWSARPRPIGRAIDVLFDVEVLDECRCRVRQAIDVTIIIKGQSESCDARAAQAAKTIAIVFYENAGQSVVWVDVRFDVASELVRLCLDESGKV